MKNKLYSFLVILITPVVIWNIQNISLISREWIKFPIYLRGNLTNIFNSKNLEKVDETRWHAFGKNREDVLSKIYYNKGYVLIDNLFSYLTFLSPRLYFLSGDGTNFSPNKVEPIASILFPFWVLGLVKLLKEKNLKLIYLSLLFSFIAFLAGQKTFAFLLPVVVFYLLISLSAVKKNYFYFLIFYILYIVGRIYVS